MDELVYDSLSRYYHTLGLKGYVPYPQVYRLLLLIFFNNYVYNDYRGLITAEDYRVIGKALYCLFGSTCLIPYPDYLKMGKMKLGSTTEIITRLKNLEDTNVLKGFDADGASGDIIITTEEEED